MRYSNTPLFVQLQLEPQLVQRALRPGRDFTVFVPKSDYTYLPKLTLADMESTADKFNLRPHMTFHTECLGANWNSQKQKWEVRLRDKKNKEMIKEASIFISAVGGISEPRSIKFPGLERFKGKQFHTAQWDHTYDYQGKRMAVIGNGCSAAQVVPSVVKSVTSIIQ